MVTNNMAIASKLSGICEHISKDNKRHARQTNNSILGLFLLCRFALLLQSLYFGLLLQVTTTTPPHAIETGKSSLQARRTHNKLGTSILAMKASKGSSSPSLGSSSEEESSPCPP